MVSVADHVHGVCLIALNSWRSPLRLHFCTCECGQIAEQIRIVLESHVGLENVLCGSLGGRDTGMSADSPHDVFAFATFTLVTGGAPIRS